MSWDWASALFLRVQYPSSTGVTSSTACHSRCFSSSVSLSLSLLTLVRATRYFFPSSVVHLIDEGFCSCSGLPDLPFCYWVLRRGFSQRFRGERQRYVPQRDGRKVCVSSILAELISKLNNSRLVSPMAIYTVSAFLGPETGLIFSGWV
jgi:hypothetical protein